jgi:hypothetical protein
MRVSAPHVGVAFLGFKVSKTKPRYLYSDHRKKQNLMFRDHEWVISSKSSYETALGDIGDVGLGLD